MSDYYENYDPEEITPYEMGYLDSEDGQEPFGEFKKDGLAHAEYMRGYQDAKLDRLWELTGLTVFSPEVH